MRDRSEPRLVLPIDKPFLETPFYGVQQMTWHLRNEGHAVNVKRIRPVIRLIRLMPISQKLETSRPAQGHKTYPNLLGGLRVEQSNQVWCADITYLPMLWCFLHLVAIMAGPPAWCWPGASRTRSRPPYASSR